MATFVAVPLKQTQEVELTKPLRSFIQNTFSQADPDDYNKALNDFSKLRNQMISKIDKHESSLEYQYRYYDQLVAIENKLPIAENQIRVQFKWRDAFDKESLFGSKTVLTIASGAYEKCCMLFNIAALQTQIAECQNHDNDEGLKTSAKFFQQASGIFGHLKDIVRSSIQQEATPDLSPDTLETLATLHQAQAQEAIYRKAVSDKMKDAIVAKIAFACSDLYADTMKLLQLQSLRNLWPKEWIPTAVMKQAAYHGLACYHSGCVAEQKKCYGEQIAQLKEAKDLLAASQQRGGSTFSFKNELAKVERDLTSAKKDNDFIYHDKIPDFKTLPPVGKAIIAKPTQFPDKALSENFTDLFAKLVPIPVYEAMTAFDNRKAEIVNGEVGRLNQHTQLMNSILASLNLPAAIEDLTGQKVPQSVVDKATQLQQMGGLQKLDKLMSDLPDLLQRNREILNEAYHQMDEEEKSDTELREKFKDRWKRTASITLTKGMRTEADKYKTILDTAINADQVIQGRYSEHREAITILSKSTMDLERSLPSGAQGGSLVNHQAVKNLKLHMEEVETIKAERSVIEQEIKDCTFDMTGKFMMAMAADGLVNEEALSSEELNRVYEPLRSQVTASMEKQDFLMGKIEAANNEFCQAKSSNQSGAQREDLLKKLAAGFDGYQELIKNLEEGTKFYNDLTPLLVKFQSKVNDFVFARQTEKEENMKEIQNQITQRPTGPTPAAPTYQQPTTPPTSGPETSQSRVPPPRPPPPTLPAGGPQSAQNSQAGPAGAASAPPPGQPPQQNYGAGSGAWGAPYPNQAGGGFNQSVQMPQGFNPWSQYAPPPQYPGQQYPGQQPYPQQQYPGQQPYQQQPYPGQPYPGQQYPGQQPYPQQGGYPSAPSYPQQYR